MSHGLDPDETEGEGHDRYRVCPISTTDQDLSIQQAALKAAGCEVMRAEKHSGTSRQGREELRTVLDFLRASDVLMVTHVTGSPAALVTCRTSYAPYVRAALSQRRRNSLSTPVLPRQVLSRYVWRVFRV